MERNRRATSHCCPAIQDNDVPPLTGKALPLHHLTTKLWYKVSWTWLLAIFPAISIALEAHLKVRLCHEKTGCTDLKFSRGF